MTIALLPFNAGPNTNAALARQISFFASDFIRTNGGVEIHPVNYLVQVKENPPQYANINPSEQLNGTDMIMQFFEQTDVDRVIDGLLVKQEGDKYDLEYRIFEKNNQTPIHTAKINFGENELFKTIRQLILDFTESLNISNVELPKNDLEMFGTKNQKAFLQFLEGYDILQYLDRSQGQVIDSFSPEQQIKGLLSAVEADKDWEGPYLALIQLCRACFQLQLGNPHEIESALKKLVELFPEDERAIFTLGEFYETVGEFDKANEYFERAQRIEPEEPAILARLGMVQLRMNMPVNAERNFKKAMELEGPEKPSADLLAQVLTQTGRQHEIPTMWKEIIDKDPKNAIAYAKYGLALFEAGQKDEALRAFDRALEMVDDTAIIKRAYAPVLAQMEDYDRAMDYYEDCLDANPSDPQLMLEYAKTLQAAGREFEVPKVLNDVLKLEIDPDTRAQVTAWLLEIEQPQRTEAVEAAQKKMESGDFAGATKDLKPLKSWLGDYWKLWALLAAAYNRIQDYEEAERAAQQLLNMFPGCEPGYGELVAALTAQNKNDEAYNVMRFAAQRIQGSLPIAINLAIAAKRSGREEEARALAQQIREAVGKNEQLEPILAELEA